MPSHTAHLVDQHILVDGLLHTLEDSQRVEHRVGLLVEFGLEDLSVGIGLHEVLAGSESHAHSKEWCYDI